MHRTHTLTRYSLVLALIVFGFQTCLLAVSPSDPTGGGKSFLDSSLVMVNCTNDVVSPTANCQDITVYLDVTGSVTVFGSDFDNGSTDNCGIDRFEINNLDSIVLDCDTVLAPPLIVVVDLSGNTNVCNPFPSITIEDTISPTMVCQDITVQLDNSGSYTLTASEIDGGSTDACGIETLTASITNIDCSFLNGSPVVLTATDTAGNSRSCTATVTAEDVTAPTASCQDITVTLGLNGNDTIAASDLNLSSADDCSLLYSASQTIFTCSDIGTQTITLTVSDSSNNSSTCTSNVLVEDNVVITTNCQDITVQLDATGSVTITPAEIGDFVDNCRVSGESLDNSTFSCANIGTNTVTLTAVDNLANNLSCTAVVTVEDTLPPAAMCRDITVFLDQTGAFTLVPDSMDNASTDNCSVTAFALVDSSVTCTDLGIFTAELIVSDSIGNTDSCMANVTVQDSLAPMAQCSSITRSLEINGEYVLAASDIDNGSSDNCAFFFAATPDTFTCSDIGANTVVLTVSDSSGNTDTCHATVTITDTTTIVANCTDITVYLDGTGNATITASDVGSFVGNCRISTSSLDVSSFSCTDIGSNPVVLTATDNLSNSLTCNANVTVADTTPPTPICQNLTLPLSAGGTVSTLVSNLDGGFSDNCGSPTLSPSSVSFTCAEVGPNDVVITATDGQGNADSCIAVVTINDGTAPTAVCRNFGVTLDSNGSAVLVPDSLDGGSTDNCPLVFTASPNTFSCADTGTVAVLLTATDPSNNTDNCTSQVTVSSGPGPVANCEDITVYLDASGNVTITPGDVGAFANNCDIATASLDFNTFACSDLGANPVILTATDNNSSLLTCNANVTVEDTLPPTMLCVDVTLSLDANGMTTSTANIDAGSSDNCFPYTLASDSAMYDCSNLGANIETLIGVDSLGNTDSCTATVTVEDNIAPTATCMDITIQLDANKEDTITAVMLDGGSSDNCGDLIFSASQTIFTCANEGNNTITLTVSDSSNNSSTCTANVHVDDLPPNGTACNFAVVLSLDSTGNYTMNPNEIGPFVDGCHIDTASLSQSTFDCNDLGFFGLVTLNWTRTNTVTGSCNAAVTVQDNIAPTAVCQDITVFLDAFGAASIVGADLDGGSTDNCSVSTLTPSQASFSCADLGSNSITLTVEDGSTNTSTCNAFVTVEDTTPPVANCQDITISLNAGGTASLVGNDVNNGSTDNCSNLSFSVDISSFTCAEMGPNTVVMTADDGSNHTDSCTAVVTVQDNMAPTAVCQDLTVSLDAQGDGSITAGDVDNNSSDNCATSVSISLSQTAFTCADTAGVTVTLTVDDLNGNNSTCTALITVEDNLAPTALCRPDSIYLDALGLGSVLPDSLDGGSTDNCGTPIPSLADSSLDCSDLGVNSLTLTLTDLQGNTSTCVAQVTVFDTLPPTAICQDITVFLDVNGDATISPSDVDNASTDKCGAPTLSLDTATFSCIDTVSRTVLLTASDASGNTDTCSAAVTVQDTTSPVANCHDVTVQLDLSGQYVVHDSIIDNGSTDNCGFSYSTGTDTLDCADLGTNSVTLTITDSSGNTATCTQDLTLQDAGNPTATCTDITVFLGSTNNGQVSITPADVDGGSTSVCGLGGSSIDISTFNCTNNGSVVTVTLTVTDNNNVASTCTSNVTVTDTIPPLANCGTATVNLDANGIATVTPASLNTITNDNCTAVGDISLSLDRDTLTCADLGSASLTLTYMDSDSNTSSCQATVTVNDLIDPVANCQDITVQLDADGKAPIIPDSLDNGSTDNCAVTAFSANVDTLFCADLGTNSVILTAMDASGNQHTCTSTVTVADTIQATPSCQDTTLYLDNNGSVVVAPSDINNGSLDNCSTQSLTTSPSSLGCNALGTPTTVTLNITDVSNNTSTCTGLVTVLDTIAPTPVCQNITVYLDTVGQVSITAPDVDGGTTDNCTVSTRTIDVSSFDCADIGPNTVTFVATDQSGVVDSCTATVTVLDSVSPIPQCRPLTVHVDSAGQTSFVTADIENGSTDNCLLDTTYLDVYSMTCANLGANTVTLTAVDSSGNSRSCSAIVTVLDTIAPIIVCDTSNVYLDANGNATYTAANADAGSTDNCAIASFGFTTVSYDCSNLGQVLSLPLSATDASGNSSNCNAVITIVDSTPPVMICQDITIQLDSSGVTSISVSDVDRGSADNCSIVSLTISDSLFECGLVGTNNVILTAVDQSGVTDSCTAIVTVEDNIAPLASCVDITVYLSDSGTTNVTTSQVAQATSDNCSIDTVVLSQAVFDCNDIGVNAVTMEVSDPSGNTTPCPVNITIEDSTAPFTVCDTIFAPIGASGSKTITLADIDLGTVDNCAIDTIMFNSQTFTCNDVAQTFQMPLTATDVNGNTRTCIGLVTVSDTIAPVVTCQNLTIFLDTTGLTVLQPSDLGSATDNCVFTDSISLDSITCLYTGVQAVTYTATDQYGLQGICTSMVTVFDTIQPEIACLNDTVYLDTNGTTFINPLDIVDFVGDGCGTVDIVVTDSTFDCQDLGLTQIGAFAVDNGQNISACLADITVRDTIDPVAVCQSDTAYLLATGFVVPAGSLTDGGSTDNCGIANFSLSIDTFRCANIGPNFVTMEVMDLDSNTSSCNAIITILDSLAPTAICQNNTITLNSFGSINLGFTDVDGGSFDNCGIASINLSSTTFTCSDVGSQSVTLTVTDNSGNSGTCTGIVTVVDSVAPIAGCQSISVTLDSTGHANISASDINNGSSDNCAINNMVLNDSLFGCGAVGSNPVILTISDDQGNIDTCSATVTVADLMPPVAACMGDTVYLDSLGGASITIFDIENGSSDNCNVASSSISIDTFSCGNLGSNSVTLTVVDPFGNSDFCTANVEVLDTLPPVAFCQNITMSLDATGSAFVTITDIDSGSVDNCGIDSSSISMQSFVCSDTGTTTIVMTVFDQAGNSSSCNSEITIVDDLPPTAACQDITLYLDAAGTGSITTADIDNGSGDNCSMDTTYIDVETFTCADVGANTVVLTAIDGEGLTNTCNATVTVIDSISPTVICQPDTVYLDSMGMGSILLSDIEVSNSDNCGVQSSMLSQSNFTLTDVGQNTVTVTVTDLSGNTGNCQGIVTVLDTIVAIDDAVFWIGQLDVWPNPTAGQFHVLLTDADHLLGEQVTFEINDISGKVLVRDREKYRASGLEKTFDLSDYAKGVYVLRIKSDGRVIVRKVIKR